MHQGGRHARLRVVPHLLRGADHQDAREQADRRRLPGDEHHPHQSRRARHGRLGSAPAERAGDDRRHRVDRLPGRVGPCAGREAQGARRLEGDDDDVDLRPPDHPGRGVGLVPAPYRPAPPGRGRLLRVGRRGARGVPRGDASAYAASASAPPLAGGRRAGRGPRCRAARQRAAPGRAGRDLAAQGLPHARAPGGSPRPARQGAEGRPGDRAREPQPDARADGEDPRLDPAHRGRGRDPARGAAADARGLLRHDRVSDRAPLLAPAAHVAAGDDRDRGAPQPARLGGEARPAVAAGAGVPVRALPPEGLPGPEAVLDRGPRRRGPDDRRAGDAGAAERRREGRDRDGAQGPAQRGGP